MTFRDLKKGKKVEVSVMYTPLHGNKYLLKLFWEETYLRLEIVHEEVSIEKHFTYTKY